MTSATVRPAPALLTVERLSVGYGRVAVLHDVVLSVGRSEIVALVGSNGAGKTTLLRAVSGLLKPTQGRVVFDDQDLNGQSASWIVEKGLLHVAEGRRLFRSQSVAANLELGLYRAGLTRAEEAARLDHVLTLFPILRDKRRLPAGSLSGGQQQMLAIAQALLRRPRLLMLDEPSLGLAPGIVEQVLDVVVTLRREGCAIVLVEQFVELALEIADHAYVLRNGRVVVDGPAATLRSSEAVRNAYTGA